MTKLPLYASALAVVALATTWSSPGRAANPFGLYTPIPKTQSQPAPYDAQAKRASDQSASDSKSFGLYTPMPPAPADQDGSRAISQAPDGQNGVK
jgi:hypothetical protein